MSLADHLPLQKSADENISQIWDTPNPMAIFSPDDRLVAANAAFRNMLFLEPEDCPTWRDLMRRNFSLGRGAKISTDDIEEWLTAAASRRGTMPFRAFEAELHGGLWLWVTETVQSDGTLLFVGTDVTALKPGTRAMREERDAARRDAWTDDLTGVANRRYAMSQLSLRLSELKARPTDAHHVVALLDIDNFKAINDRYGHEFGDVVLKFFSRQAMESLRANDLFGRIGGEEFLLLMPNCGVEAARVRLEQLLVDTRDTVVSPDHSYFRFSFSGGVTILTSDDTIDGVLKRADELLYLAKDLGRNRILTDRVALRS